MTFNISSSNFDNDDFELDEDSSGDLVLTHKDSGATFKYDSSESVWIPSGGLGSANNPVSSIHSDSVNADQIGNGHWRVGPNASGGDLQDTINAANPGDIVVIEPSTSGIDTTTPITIDKKLTLMGESMTPTPRSETLLTGGSDYQLTGAVINQTAAGEHGIEITTGNDEAINLFNLGVHFVGSHADSNTGHGVYVNPPADGQGNKEYSINTAKWSNVNVVGHDGDHYAFKLVNPILSEFSMLRGIGGGGLCLVNDSRKRHNGNLTFMNTHFTKRNSGSAHGHFYDAQNEVLNIISHFYPSIRRNAGGGEFVTYNQNTNGTNASVSRIHYYAANMEGTQATGRVDLPQLHRMYLPLHDANDVTYGFERPWGDNFLIGEFDMVDWYLLDDFEDNGLTNRNGQYLAETKTTADGDLTAVHRPDWTIGNGSASASNGELQIPAGDSTTQIVRTDSNMTTGRWSIDFTYQTAPSTGTLYWGPMWNDSSDRWLVEINSDGSVNLVKDTASGTTTVISGSTSDWGGGNTNTHWVEVERVRGGHWRLEVDGAEIGTAADTFVPDLRWIRFDHTADAAVHIDTVDARPN